MGGEWGREEHSVLEGQVVGLGRVGEGGAGCVRISMVPVLGRRPLTYVSLDL